MPKPARILALLVVLLPACADTHPHLQRPQPPPPVVTSTLEVDFGPLSQSHPKLNYVVPWTDGEQPVGYLQSATKLQPQLEYTCVAQGGKACTETHADCQVTSINGVKAQTIDGKEYYWMWFIDGQMGALSPCIFGVGDPKRRISFKLSTPH